MDSSFGLWDISIHRRVPGSQMAIRKVAGCWDFPMIQRDDITRTTQNRISAATPMEGE